MAVIWQANIMNDGQRVLHTHCPPNHCRPFLRKGQPLAASQVKRCRCCNQDKPLTGFSKRRASSDGLQLKCKECYRVAHQNGGKAVKAPRQCAACHQEKPAEHFRRATNRWTRSECMECEKEILRCCKCGELKQHEQFAPDKQIATGRKSQCRACDAAHQSTARKSSAFKAKRKEYREQPAVKAKELAYGQAYFSTEHGRSKVRKYHQTTKGYAARARRRAKKREVESTLTAQEWLSILAEHGNACFYCRREFDLFLTAEQDHKIPISKGGPHTKDNIVPACRHCNASKNDGDMPKTPPKGNP